MCRIGIVNEEIIIPYDSVNELPDSVQNVLPKHAQDIYKEAYNSAYEQYENPSKRQGDESREEAAHKVAWGAVKNAGYQKGRDGKWRK